MSDVSKPRVSVVLPIYNGEAYVAESIASVLRQSLSDFELLIIDDGSRDRSAEIAASFADARIKFRKGETNRGLFFRLNQLIREASSPLIKLWSQDDIMLETCLERGVDFFREHPELGCFYNSCDTIGASGELIATRPYDTTPIVISRELGDRLSLQYGCLAGNIANMFFPRAIFDAVGWFKEDWISADFEMMVRILGGYEIGRIDAVLVRVRDHNRQWSKADESFLRFLRNDLEIQKTLIERLLHAHRSMSESEIHAIVREKLSQNLVHGALRRLLRGRKEPALELVRQLGARESALLTAWWLRDLPRRFAARLRLVR